VYQLGKSLDFSRIFDKNDQKCYRQKRYQLAAYQLGLLYLINFNNSATSVYYGLSNFDRRFPDFLLKR